MPGSVVGGAEVGVGEGARVARDSRSGAGAVRELPRGGPLPAAPYGGSMPACLKMARVRPRPSVLRGCGTVTVFGRSGCRYW